MDRLRSSLVKIHDVYPKVIISFDLKTQILPDGIIALNALDFLMGGTWEQ